jgi:hypothetical protein
MTPPIMRCCDDVRYEAVVNKPEAASRFYRRGAASAIGVNNRHSADKPRPKPRLDHTRQSSQELRKWLVVRDRADLVFAS